MNVLILTPELHPYKAGGVGMHVYYVNKLLASKPKYNVVLFAVYPRGMKRNRKASDAELINFIYLLPFPLASVSYMVKSLMVFFLVKRKVKVNVIHAHTAGLQIMFSAYLMSVLGKIPFLITAHGSDVRIFKKVRIVKLLQSFLLKKASYVTCVSKEMKQILTGEYGLEDDKISIVPNGYDNNLVFKRKERRFQGRENKIVFVGRLDSAKDPSTLIQAFKRISTRHADVKLLIIGDGPLRKGLETLSKELDIANRVFFCGQVSHENAMAIMAECDIYVLTSIDEGLPTSLIEAMALGKPIIATNVGGVPEIVKDGINGLLVPPKSPERVAQAVERLLNEPRLAKRLATSAVESIQDHSWRSIVTKYEQIYEALT